MTNVSNNQRTNEQIINGIRVWNMLFIISGHDPRAEVRISNFKLGKKKESFVEI